MPESTDLISSAEAAEILGVDRATLNRWKTSGRIAPTIEMPGKTGARLYARTDVEQLRDERAASALATSAGGAR